MTVVPKLEKSSTDYVLNIAGKVLEECPERRAGSEGERKAQKIWLGELMKFCDETVEEKFKVHPGAGTLTQKILSVLLIVCNIMFVISAAGGKAGTAVVSLVLSLFSFSVFAYKFIFDGDKLNFIIKQKYSVNVFGKRYSRNDVKDRVVLVARADAPYCLRSRLFGANTPFAVSTAAMVGNTLLFCSEAAFLFSGAPQKNNAFTLLSILCVLFIPVYVCSLLLVDPKGKTTGVSSSLIPAATVTAILKQMHDTGSRYESTELCFLIVGSEYSSHTGAYAFAKRHRRRFSDVPTVFIPIDEITSSENLSVFFRDGSGVSGNTEIASVVAEAADNLNIKLKKERLRLGSASYTPFSAAGLSSCSLGTTKRKTGIVFSPEADRLASVKSKTTDELGALIIETLNYFDSRR